MRKAIRPAMIMSAGFATPAGACTLCYSRVAQDVRAAVLGPDFWLNIGALLLPFPILIAAVLLVRRASP
jgi:hypothetical protein